jgi:hypothetical protein
MIFSGNEKGAARDERRGRRVFANPDLDCPTGGGISRRFIQRRD